jgi:hypothetical protein
MIYLMAGLAGLVLATVQPRGRERLILSPLLWYSAAFVLLGLWSISR